MRLHRPSLAAFCRDLAQAAAVTIVTAVVADYRAEVIRLRAENADLERDVERLAALLDGAYEDMAADHAAGTRRDEAMRRHPAGKGWLQASDLHTAKVAASADVRYAMFGAEDLDEWRRELGVRG